MKINYADVLFLKATEKPFDMTSKGGTKGVSYKAKLLIDGDVFNAKISEVQFKQYEAYKEARGSVELEILPQASGASVGLLSFKE